MKNSDLRIAGIFKVLSFYTRLRIVRILEKEKSVKEISEILNRSSQNISQHLRFLRARGIVGYKRKRNKHIYFLRKKEIVKAINIIEKIFKRGAK